MVLINLSKLMKFVAVISLTPKEVSKRKSRLIEAYNELEADTNDSVSIKMSPELERFSECHVDSEESEMRCKILQQLINDYTDSNITLPKSISFKTFLFPPITNCPGTICSRKVLTICRPTRTENALPVFTVNGVYEGEVYRKICPICQVIYYYNYFEKQNEASGELVRTYYKYNQSEGGFFSTTNNTFFEQRLLDTLTEEIVTCNVQFDNWATCYNRLFRHNNQVSVKLVIPAWMIYQMWKRIHVCFPVQRDKFRNLDIEAVCAHLYPELRQVVDRKWHPHVCFNCRTRLVVLDGDAKAYRTVCSFDAQKVIKKGKLNEFLECAESPLPGKDKCYKHLRDSEEGDTVERLDFGRMTRGKRKELGINVDFLTTEEGCRKRDNITQRTERSKTSGMLYCYRPCGISLGHVECISSESCTAFQLLLFELFGEYPDKKELTGVVIDRACDVHPYVKRIGEEGNAACAFYSKLAWLVDPFHIKGHKEPKCILSHPDAQYHPDLPKYRHLTEDVNLEICEQSFRKINKWKFTTRYLTVNKRLVFLKLLDDERNLRLEERILVKKGKPSTRK